MNKLTIGIACLLALVGLEAAAFENATTCVKNMRIGWNLGNTLDACSSDINNMWIEAWTAGAPSDYETAWQQKEASEATIKMLKAAGFNAIRVPVTWTGHMGNIKTLAQQGNGKVDFSQWAGYDVEEQWMARVHQVVDYVIDNGMYCILNVHHDTGEASSAWLRADMDAYAANRARFEALWTQIANEFIDYDEHLLFEGYNEMLDTYGSWCFASMSHADGYNATVATSAYDAINSYAQSFVDAVRATGGNNAERNLIVNTYGSCCGTGSWNTHLTEPLINMKRPTDAATNHIIFEVHFYPDIANLTNTRSEVQQLIARLNSNLVGKGAPVLVGEWGTLSDPSTTNYYANLCEFAQYFVEQTKAQGIGTLYWMGLTDGDDRLTPTWTQPELKDAIVRGWYGENGYQGIDEIATDHHATNATIYNLQGMPVAEPLAPGIYIKDGKKYRVR